MKTLIGVIITLATINLTFSQTLNGKITYRARIIISPNVDFLNNDVIMPPPIKELEIKSGMDAEPINFHLFFNDKESLYKAEHDIMTYKKLGLLLNQTNLIGHSDITYYTNIESKEKFYHGYWTQNVLVNMDTIDWQLSQETKQIGKYTCYKATATIDSKQPDGMNFLSPVVAWYTPEIPISFGIQTFVGLPGLTLELTADYIDGKIHYYASEVELYSEKEIEIERPKAERKVSEKEYVELLKKLNANR